MGELREMPRSRGDMTTVGILEDLLEDARAGKVNGLIVVGSTMDGEYLEVFSATVTGSPMIYITPLEIAKHRLLRLIEMPADEICGMPKD